MNWLPANHPSVAAEATRRTQVRNPFRRLTSAAALIRSSFTVLISLAAGPTADSAETEFRRSIQPILKEFCFDCHGDGANKGGVAFDASTNDVELLGNHDLWLRVLKNVRAGLMPPPRKPQPEPSQKHQLEEWIKQAVFHLDPRNPDPGRVTVRRLNRVEYRNTVRDLLGVDFDTEKEFPPDDAGHGFDNIGDVLTLPPMLLEKYLAAAKTVVTKAVPQVPLVPAERTVAGRSFAGLIGETSRTNRGGMSTNALALSYYEAASVSNTVRIERTGRYQLRLDFAANERFVDNQFDYNKCRVIFRADGEELHRRDYTREGGKAFNYEFELDWKEGEHVLAFEVEPLTPDQKQVRSLTVRLDSVTVRGPMDSKYWVRPKNYERFYPRPTPADAVERRRYAHELLAPFARNAYRRPVDALTIERLVGLAESIYSQTNNTFEAGIGQAMIAVLASPRFLFREEGTEPAPGKTNPWIDEYALASRLSYFLWSSMPDDELLRLAGQKRLRSDLPAQTRRMLDDSKSDAFVRNFVGQWLQTRDIDTVQIDARQVLGREAAADPDQERRRQRFRALRDRDEATLTPEEKKELEEIRGTLFRRFGRAPRAELTGDLRRAMRLETERSFDFVLRQDRSLIDLLDSDYTFLNERLARHYGLTNLQLRGEEMVRVKLPPDSPRGGVMTQGSVLAVTSNPTRTSPVKRGLFILDNLLGTPPPPPPPDIPPLEDAAKAMRERTLSLRETLALHREQPLCSSCHNRMDPLGLALENFNAMGMWRTQERSQPIDATGQLLSGESFSNIRELKKVLASNHASAFYRTVTEKLLIYALGRGLEYYDLATVDAIVARLEKTNGRPSELLSGILESPPFQQTRALQPAENSARAKAPSNPTSSIPSTDRADARKSP